MRVTVWHNMVTGYHSGYRPEHPMLPVYSYSAPDGPAEDQLWRAVMLCNADPEMLDGQDREITTDYRGKRLRSFSPGDGFSVIAAGRQTFWASNGRALVRLDAGFITLAAEGGWGSVPTGHRVTYRVPMWDDLTRLGHFEFGHRYAATAAEAVALFHGIGKNEVAITRDPVTSLRRSPIRYPDGAPPPPYGCRWCGRERSHHGMSCLRGLSGWTRPTDAQILARMKARRAARGLG
ncbi:hypothetical protein [Streptomyces sp. NPDC093589]|uniref:hypothetical protein n=1 Tax=Streptomyces sp. NPDC093589 TaxID=3366043 RepID=UPI0038107A62